MTVANAKEAPEQWNAYNYLISFIDLLGHSDWTVLRQVRTRDHDTLPAVLTRQQVHDLINRILPLPTSLWRDWMRHSLSRK